MKNLVTLLAIASGLTIFSFTCLKENPQSDAGDIALIHNVYFWLNEDLSEQEKKDFEIALASLGAISSIESYYWGVPSDTDKREVVDYSYDYAINAIFKSKSDHDAYQEDPIHVKFVNSQEKKFKAVKVYDNNIVLSD